MTVLLVSILAPSLVTGSDEVNSSRVKLTIVLDRWTSQKMPVFDLFINIALTFHKTLIPYFRKKNYMWEMKTILQIINQNVRLLSTNACLSEDISSLYCIKLYFVLKYILDFFWEGGQVFPLPISFNIISFYYKSFIIFLRFKANFEFLMS